MGAVYVEPFELRRLVLKWQRIPTGVVVEDDIATTLHFAKLTAGVPDAAWVTADYTAIEARIATWWTAIRAHHPVNQRLHEYRWYKAGPVFSPADRADGPANPATRITAPTVLAGTGAGAGMPPATAITVTLVNGIRKRWGRMYLPAPLAAEADADGRIATVANWLTPTVAFLNGCRADGKQPVVFSRGRSAYVTPHGTAIAAHVASAYEVTDAQVDNQFDVMESRRWSQPTVRTRTALT